MKILDLLNIGVCITILLIIFYPEVPAKAIDNAADFIISEMDKMAVSYLIARGKQFSYVENRPLPLEEKNDAGSL